MSDQPANKCCDLVNHLCEYIDGDLNEETRRIFDEHLKDCKNCQIVVNTLTKTIEICKEGTEKIHLPNDVHNRLLKELGLDQ